MASSALRLFLISVAVIMLAFFSLLGARWMGYQQSFQPPSHPWFERDFWAVYSPTAEEVCNKLDLSPGPNWIVEIPLKPTKEDWQIPCAKPLALTDFLKRTKVADILLNIQAHDTWGLDRLVEITAPYDATKRFAVTTEAQKVAIFLRKKAPQWLFAAEASSLVRLRAFESFYIESAMDFWPDFVISEFNPAKNPLLQIDERMATELARRKKRILWNWNENASQDPPVAIQGIMTNRPSAAQQKWHGRL
jgi:hypothetical protein